MTAKKMFDTEILSADEARASLSELRSRGSSGRTSKFDPLKQHIQWLERGKVLRIEEMKRTDIANLRSYIQRNIKPLGKGLEYVVRSSRIERDDDDRYRVFVFVEKTE